MSIPETKTRNQPGRHCQIGRVLIGMTVANVS